MSEETTLSFEEETPLICLEELPVLRKGRNLRKYLILKQKILN